MREKTSIIVVISLLALLSTTASAATGEKLLDMIPEDNFGVLVVNFEQLVDSKAYKDLYSLVEKEGGLKDLEEIERALGFDLEKDLDTILLAFPPEMEEDDDELTLILEGKFDEKAIVELLKSKGETVNSTEYKGYTLYYEREGKDPYMVFIDRYLIVGTPTTVKDAIDVIKGGKSIADNADKKKYLNDIDKKADIWGFMIASPGMKKELSREMPDLGNVNGVIGSLDFSKGMNMIAVLRCQDDGVAKSLKGFIDQGIAEISKDKDVGKMLMPFLSKVTTTTNGKDLKMSMDLNQKEFDGLIELLISLFFEPQYK